MAFRGGTSCGLCRAGPVGGADEFDGLRQKWFNVLTGGGAFDPNDPDFAAQIRMIEDKVQNGQTGVWDTLQAGADRAGCDCLWTDLTGTAKSGNNVVAYDRCVPWRSLTSHRGAACTAAALCRRPSWMRWTGCMRTVTTRIRSGTITGTTGKCPARKI
ncbi:hypothetical protein LJK87_29165 [Paenibacillus sp. P25]|nr:hypothetical protein LJK87_29165 [Paenibacillus sp. P25]